MQYFKLDGTIYRVDLQPGEDWRDCSRDVLKRWSPEAKAWMDSDLSVSFVRSFGTPTTSPVL
jgi:hypothetical protein